MLPKKFRLTQRQARYVLAKARRIRFNVYVLCAMPSHSAAYRFGVMVSSKVYSKAVKRNSVRRKIYGVVERWMDSVSQTKTKYNVMIIVCRPVTSEDLKNLSQFLSKTLT